MMTIALLLCVSLNNLTRPNWIRDSVEVGDSRDSLIQQSDSTTSTSSSEQSRHRLNMQDKGPPPGILFSGSQPRRLSQFGYSSQLSASAVESLIVEYPGMKRAILKELLMPSGPPPYLASVSRQRDLLHQIDSLSRMTPFEEMGLSAKRYLEYYDNPIDKKMKLPQADIFRIIRWLAQLFK